MLLLYFSLLVGAAIANPVLDARQCSSTSYGPVAGFPQGMTTTVCYDTGYYQAADQGQTQAPQLRQRCQNLCTADTGCTAVLSAIQYAADSNLATGVCFFYRNIPSPRQCTDNSKRALFADKKNGCTVTTSSTTTRSTTTSSTTTRSTTTSSTTRSTTTSSTTTRPTTTSSSTTSSSTTSSSTTSSSTTSSSTTSSSTTSSSTTSSSTTSSSTTSSSTTSTTATTTTTSAAACKTLASSCSSTDTCCAGSCSNVSYGSGLYCCRPVGGSCTLDNPGGCCSGTCQRNDDGVTARCI